MSLKVSRTVVRRGGAALLAAGCAAGLFVVVGAAHRAVAAGTDLNLGDAASYAVLASGTITGSATSTVTGDVGGSTVDGLGGRIGGAVRMGRGTAQALADLGEAADGIASTAPTATMPTNGATLGPGVYQVTGSLDVPDGLTLDAGGNADAVFIIRTAAALTTGDATRMALTGGARACHVFWVADDTATVDGTVVGSVIAGSGLTVRDGASVTGRLFSRTGDVTLDHATVRVPTDCGGPPSTTPTPVAPPGGTATDGSTTDGSTTGSTATGSTATGSTAAAGTAAAAVSAPGHAGTARARATDAGSTAGHGASATTGATSRRASTAAASGGVHEASTAAGTRGTHRGAGATGTATTHDDAPAPPARSAARGGGAPDQGTPDDASAPARRDAGATTAAEGVISRLGSLGDVAGTGDR